MKQNKKFQSNLGKAASPPPSNTRMPKPTPFTTPNDSSIGSRTFAQLPGTQQSPHWLRWEWDAPNSPPKLSLPPSTITTPSNKPIPRPTPRITPNGIRIQLAVLPQYTFWTDRQTDKPYGHYASRRRSGKNSRCYN